MTRILTGKKPQYVAASCCQLKAEAIPGREYCKYRILEEASTYEFMAGPIHVDCFAPRPYNKNKNPIEAINKATFSKPNNVNLS